MVLVVVSGKTSSFEVSFIIIGFHGKGQKKKTLNREALFIVNKLLTCFPLLVLFILLTTQPVFSAETTNENAIETGGEEVSPPEEAVNGEDTVVDTWHRTLSGTIIGSANWIDSFFYDERIQAEENQSRLLLRLESFSEEGEGTDVKLRASLRIAIPYAQKRLKLIVSGDPDNEPDIVSTTGGVVRRTFDQVDRNDVSVSLQHAIMQELQRYLSTRLGFVFRNWKPRVFIEGRYRTFHDLDLLGLRFTERIRWYTDKGWESRSTLDIERPLSESFFFRTSVEGDWLEDQDGFPHSLTFALSQFLSSRRAIEYSCSSGFQTSPNYHLEEVALRIRYRQRIWRDWLFYDIEPQLRFPNEEGFKMLPGILLRLEAIIGKYKRL